MIITNESLLSQFPIISDELFRLRIEPENQDAVKLVEAGLRNGRYLEVVSVAKMVQKYDRNRIRSQNTATEMENNIDNINFRNNNELGREIYPLADIPIGNTADQEKGYHYQ